MQKISMLLFLALFLMSCQPEEVEFIDLNLTVRTEIQDSKEKNDANRIRVRNIEALRKLPFPNTKNRKEVLVLGYYEPGDGGGGIFEWNPVSTEMDNGGTIIALDGKDIGRWKRIFEGAVNVKWFGAKGNGIDNDASHIQAAINSEELELYFPQAVYAIEASLQFIKSIKVDFNGSEIKRKPGKRFNMIVAKDVDYIYMNNLFINGNKDADSSVSSIISHRFSGLYLENVTNSLLERVTVMGTVNAEDQDMDIKKKPAAGIFLINCRTITCIDLNGFNNDRTAIFIKNGQEIKIFGSRTYNNLGSGISGGGEYCEYVNLISYNNGYSNISVNGKHSKVKNVLTYGSKYSGVNIGHLNHPADYTIIENIKSFDNDFEGITVGGSKQVKIINSILYNNKRNNIRLFNGSTECEIVGNDIYNSVNGQGVFIETGSNYSIRNCRIFRNAVSGIYVNKGVKNISIKDCQIFNNCQVISSAGIILDLSIGCEIISNEFYDTQEKITQEIGINISGGNKHIIANNTYNNTRWFIFGYNLPKDIEYLNNLP